MDGSDILDIQPRQLNFLFELKKQSSCSVRLRNNLNDYVAFKVKTTSPKKYSVRPNVGIIQPGSFYEFTVTMQAPKIAPPDMICKDKFLVQSIVVPAGTSDDDITSSMFSKDDGRYIQEVKLRVLLLSPPNSPILSSINATVKHDPVPNYLKSKDHVLHKLGYAQNNPASDEASEAKSDNSEATETGKDLKFKPKKKVEDEHPEYGSAKELEDHLPKYIVYKNMKMCAEDTKTLDNLIDEEDSMGNVDLKTLNHVKDVDYSKMSEDSKILDLTDDLKDTMGNGDVKTLHHFNDEYYKKKNDDPKTLDVTDDLEYEALNTIKHLKQSFRDKNNPMDEVKEFTKKTEYPMMDDVEVKLPDTHHNRKRDIEDLKLDENVEQRTLKSTIMKDTNASKLVKEVEEMKSKINMLELMLKEAKVTISKLTEERRGTGQEKESLRQKLSSLRSKRGDERVQVGFPFFFVCMVALVSMVLGYTLRL